MYTKAKTRLVSFADGAFSTRKKSFQKMAQESNFFDSVNVYDLNSLPVDFQRTHKNFMTESLRGFGYWIWKPVIIFDELKLAEPDDCVVYMDAGFTINQKGRFRFQEYLELTRDSKFKMLSFSNIFTESHWTKQDCATRIGVEATSSHMKTSQLGGGLIILQKSRSNIDLLKDWSEIAIEDKYRYSDDSPSKLENHKSFHEHRHDQSISSLLRKSRGTEITHYEVQSYKCRFDELAERLPAWATRSKQ